MKSRKTAAVIIVILCLSLLLNCCASTEKSKSYQKSDVSMGSVVSIQLYTLGDADAEQVAQQMITKIKQLDTLISKNDENATLYKLNTHSGEAVATDEELVDYLLTVKEIYALSGGRLSVSSGALTELWGIDTDEFRLPSDEEINKALGLCDDSTVIIDKDELTVKTEKGQILNLGSVGKGIACDKAVEYFNYTSQSCQGAVISVGGSVAVIGSHDGKQDWAVGIRNPFGDVNDYFCVLTTQGGSFVSTSGSYEKTFEENGKTYHHILNLKTGYPADNGLVSVSVRADSGLLSDALSTMCFVLGREESEEILKKYSADAVFVYEDKSVYITDGIKDSVRLVSEEFTLK